MHQLPNLLIIIPPHNVLLDNEWLLSIINHEHFLLAYGDKSSNSFHHFSYEQYETF